MSLRGRDFISLGDFSAEELHQIWEKASELKKKLKHGISHEELVGKYLAMVFEYQSTRTRTSFEVGIQQLGGHALFYAPQFYWTKERESPKDFAKVLSRYVHGIMIRANNHSDVVELARWADIPVINGLTNFEHPCQVMADLMTTKEEKGELSGKKTVIAWTYSLYNVALGIVNSALFAGSKMGMDVTIACPEGYDPDKEVWERCEDEARKSGAHLSIERNLNEAVKGADVIHIKTWAPHEVFTSPEHPESPHVKDPNKYKHWKITKEIVDLAGRDVNVQHALPVLRGVQATDEVLDGPNSVIYDEAENRLHVQKAIMSLIM